MPILLVSAPHRISTFARGEGACSMAHGLRNFLLAGVSFWLCLAIGQTVRGDGDQSPSAGGPKASETPPGGAPKYKLAFNFQPGQVVRYEVVHSTEITTLYDQEKESVFNKSEAKRA